MVWVPWDVGGGLREIGVRWFRRGFISMEEMMVMFIWEVRGVTFSKLGFSSSFP